MKNQKQFCIIGMRKTAICVLMAFVMLLTYAPTPASTQGLLDWDSLDPANSVSLTVEIRSEVQAIITLTDTRLQDKIQTMIDIPEFSGLWVIGFGDSTEYFVNATSVLNRPGEIVGDFYKGTRYSEREYIYFLTPMLRAIRPKAPQRMRFDGDTARSFAFTLTEDSLVWEVSMPPSENIDFTKVTQYDFSYTEMQNGISFGEANFNISFMAADVADMRNFGQMYDIGVPDTEIMSNYYLHEMVLGVTYEQAEMLYFTPPESRYVIWRGRLEGGFNPADFWSDGEDKWVHLDQEVYEIVCFDENGLVTNVMTKMFLDEEDYAFSFIVDFRGFMHSKQKVVRLNDGEILYTRSSVSTRSGTNDSNGYWFLEKLEELNIRHIDDYIEGMKNRDLIYELTEIIERRD